MSVWSGVEWMAGGESPGESITALASVWRSVLGDSFGEFKSAFLRVLEARAGSVPCPDGCGCHHEVIEHGDGSLVGVCQCESWCCEDLPLTVPEVVLLELNEARLGRAICHAIGCDVKEGSIGVAGVRQIGAFGAVALPVLLAVPSGGEALRGACSKLAARLRSGFALVVPTARSVDAGCQEFLAGARAGIFTLDSIMGFLPGGRLHSARSAGELFSDLLPDRESPMESNEARRVFAMVRKLKGRATGMKAPLHDVFSLLVLEGNTQRDAAEACGCSTGLISTRVRELEDEFGMRLDRLRALAARDS